MTIIKDTNNFNRFATILMSVFEWAY